MHAVVGMIFFHVLWSLASVPSVLLDGSCYAALCQLLVAEVRLLPPAGGAADCIPV